MILISLLLLGCPNTNHNNEKINVKVEVYDGIHKLFDEEIQVNKGTNGLEATIQVANNVEYQSSAFGVFVTSIGGVESDSEHYWALYVNGEYANKAIDKYILNEDTAITWKLEKISESPFA